MMIVYTYSQSMIIVYPNPTYTICDGEVVTGIEVHLLKKALKNIEFRCVLDKV